MRDDWKIPHYAESTVAVVRHQWLMLVHGPNYTHDHEEADTSPENYPDYMTKRDQPDRRTR